MIRVQPWRATTTIQTAAASQITATNVPAGDYTIIVESAQMPGGAFGVSIATH